MFKITSNQLKLIKAFDDWNTRIVLLTGPAGSGKTMWMCKTAQKMYNKNRIDKLVITRPTVSGDEEIGFLPGSIGDKMKPWMAPIYDYIHSDDPIEIEEVPLGFMRGRTFNRTFIIADEMQNSTNEQMKMLLTRIGKDSLIGVTGDTGQSDLNQNGMDDFVDMLPDDECILSIQHIEFDNNDIKRDNVVKDVLDVYDRRPLYPYNCLL